MPSPFPGMDPYLEAPELWPDFHNNLAPEIQGYLNPQITPKYVARLVPRLSYDGIDIGRSRTALPDIGVWRTPTPPREGGIALASPIGKFVESIIPVEEPMRFTSVEIRKTNTGELVTAIEILSPSNKRRGHDDHETYLKKRRELLRSQANLVEIDLLRGGDRPPLEVPVPPAPYYITVSRSETRPKVQVFPVALNEALPAVPIPLREPDPDAVLDLATCFTAVFERASYAVSIDYGEPVPPPELDAEEQRLVASFLKR